MAGFTCTGISPRAILLKFFSTSRAGGPTLPRSTDECKARVVIKEELRDDGLVSGNYSTLSFRSGASATGNVKLNVDPWPSTLVTLI
jgi:hypothetical protein